MRQFLLTQCGHGSHSVAYSEYDGPVLTTLPSSHVNATHWKWVYRCQNCTSWANGGIDVTSGAALAWAYSSVGVDDPSDPQSTFQEHTDCMSTKACHVPLLRCVLIHLGSRLLRHGLLFGTYLQLPVVPEWWKRNDWSHRLSHRVSNHNYTGHWADDPSEFTLASSRRYPFPDNFAAYPIRLHRRGSWSWWNHHSRSTFRSR